MPATGLFQFRRRNPVYDKIHTCDRGPGVRDVLPQYPSTYPTGYDFDLVRQNFCRHFMDDELFRSRGFCDEYVTHVFCNNMDVEKNIY